MGLQICAHEFIRLGTAAARRTWNSVPMRLIAREGRLTASNNYFDWLKVPSNRCTPERRMANRIIHPIMPAV